MLDNLVESKNNKIHKNKLRKLLLIISTLTVSGVIFALILSLFSQNLAMGQDAINLSELVTPTAIPQAAPPAPEPDTKSVIKSEKDVKTKITTRKENILRVEESPRMVPPAISSKPSKNNARPKSDFEKGLTDKDIPKASSFSENTKFNSDGSETRFIDNNTSTAKKIDTETPIDKKEIPKPPLPPQPKKEKVEKTIVTGGVVNGNAIKLVKPVYSAAAKSANIRGQVTVQVLIDENGKVISAQAIAGHSLLKSNAVSAARGSTFTPTTLSGNKVKVKGLIVYNFN